MSTIYLSTYHANVRLVELIFLNIINELLQSLHLLALSFSHLSIGVSKQVQDFVETSVNKEV